MARQHHRLVMLPSESISYKQITATALLEVLIGTHSSSLSVVTNAGHPSKL